MDHDALKYLINRLDLSGYLAQWMLFLQEFDFTIVVHPKEGHGNANYLSWLEPLENSNLETLNDQVFDADVLEVDIILLKYVDIITYLKTNQIPWEYNLNQVQALLKRSAPFILLREISCKQWS